MKLKLVLVVHALLSGASLAASHPIPPGAVIAFNSHQCPPGWEEYSPAYGRFIRGIDRGETKVDPVGERGPGSHQEDQFASHSHARPKGVYDAGGGPASSWVAHGRYFGYGHSNPPATGEAGGNETRPENVALLYCEKKE